MKALVTGGAGFIGSHIADALIERGDDVYIVDNLLTGDMENVNPKAIFFHHDLRDGVDFILNGVQFDVIFHTAAIARTQWCIDDPMLSNETNITATLKLLMWAKDNGVKKFVHSSSCIVYVETTPYWVGKVAAENYVSIFPSLYGLSTISLRYSNCYGSLRQSEKGPAINCIASLRKSKREDGYIWITGTGEQTRDFIHVQDVVKANIIASQSSITGAYDICTGQQTSMNKIASYFNCPIKYVPERDGDVDAIYSNPFKAERDLGFRYEIEVPNGIEVYL